TVTAGVGLLQVTAPGAVQILGSTVEALNGNFSITGTGSVTIDLGAFVGAQTSAGAAGNGSLTSDGLITIQGASNVIANRNLTITSTLGGVSIDNTSGAVAGATFGLSFSTFTGNLNIVAPLAISISGGSFVGSDNGNATVDSTANSVTVTGSIV